MWQMMLSLESCSYMLLVAVIGLDNRVFFWSVWYIQALDGWSHVTLWGTQWVGHLPALFPVSGLLGFVGFDAADVVWSTFNQCAHQVIGLSLKDVKDHNDVKLANTPNALTELSALHWLLKDSTHTHTLSFQGSLPTHFTEHTPLFCFLQLWVDPSFQRLGFPETVLWWSCC